MATGNVPTSTSSNSAKAAAQADIVARPPGQPPARVDLRVGDARTVRVDCRPLLREHELMVRIDDVKTVSGVAVQNQRVRAGTLLEALFMGAAEPGTSLNAARPSDCALRFQVSTTQGVLVVDLQVRLHA